MPTRTRTLGTFLAVWSVAFATVHMAWAMGWRGGLPDDVPDMTDRPWFLVYDVVAGLLMYAAAGVALHVTSGRAAPRWRTATLVGSAAALGRGAPAHVGDLDAGEVSRAGLGADVWFTVAGVVGLLLWRATRPAARGGTPALGRPLPAGGVR